MPGPATLIQRTTDGEIDTAGNPRIVYAATLTAGGAAATAVLRSGGSGGDVLLTLKAAANETTNEAFPEGVSFPKGCHVGGLRVNGGNRER